jgi:hypothetical protein
VDVTTQAEIARRIGELTPPLTRSKPPLPAGASFTTG